MISNRSLSYPCEKPNFLVILVDEERYPPVYENKEIQQWRRENLVTQELLRSNSIEFHSHYIGSAACCPSRATMFTGHYPSLHGVSQTNGIAKGAFDSDMFWLGRNTVPTMGNYFREAGYQTYYKGKWHISYEDIVIPGTHQGLSSYHPLTGVPDQKKEDLYLNADPLDSFGFSSWIGPEPHGKNPRNSASSAAFGVSGRDVVYASEVVELIEALDQQKAIDNDALPWLVVASFVNPHDIVLYGSLTERLPMFNFDVEPMPSVAPPPTINEPLDTKPRCQASYQHIYPRALQPIINQPHYRKLYYQLQKNADQQMLKVFEALTRSSFYDDTIIIFTSDHGELLGAHGHLHQKFYCAYEEMLHVPFLIHNKKLFPQQHHFNTLTSHLDLLPTMLGLAHADTEDIQHRLQNKFSEVRPFVGRDLSPYLLGHNKSDPVEEPIYFMIDDDVTQGQRQINPLGEPYPSVVQPNHIETVISHIERNNRKELWKYSRYFDNDQFWSHPGKKDVTVQTIGGHPAGMQSTQYAAYCVTSVKTQPLPDEYELYNLTDDPLETRNLAHPAYASEQSRTIQEQMASILKEQRQQKRLVSQNTSGSQR
ncbi:sulfatase-like hydrolase/transferase [Paenibacillus radicis (ex Xue et al. 2023)]|uniref:Sulfatase-like hydrolase/transferase n=1 Tax=Paenibacillus radicis (ex Xue et al. 2023) TaxID=2972489 RepID=A0ABT1YM80_9BACL|nr:sulfatase-like hydrolase/transferase [Paenibacillus radicis (ex Xue et al. 2023)]MCR8634285.1 sulfatase-like hydrolase/transferase [Paenibacillus radicis (ex Xue et al. 2023)]